MKKIFIEIIIPIIIFIIIALFFQLLIQQKTLQEIDWKLNIFLFVVCATTIYICNKSKI